MMVRVVFVGDVFFVQFLAGGLSVGCVAGLRAVSVECSAVSVECRLWCRFACCWCDAATLLVLKASKGK